MCVLRAMLALFLALPLLTLGQQNAPVATATGQDSGMSTTASADASTKTELSVTDTGTTFKLRVNLVQVRAVVRDSKGKTVEGLKREDFQLFDQGKLQMISTFGVETPETRLEKARADATVEGQASAGSAGVLFPQRFVALVFDDIHLNLQDAMVVRKSAEALIENLAETDRLAIYGTSGQIAQDFTADKTALERILPNIIPRPVAGSGDRVTNCPDVTHYMAVLADRGDPNVFTVVVQETLACMFANTSDPGAMTLAKIEAKTALDLALTLGDTDNLTTCRAVQAIIRRMTQLPGERVLVLASPGFVSSLGHQWEDSQLIEDANKAGVVINTLDARGLYAPDLFGDISSPPAQLPPQLLTAHGDYRLAGQLENQFVLGDFAAGTGGTFFHNSNDLEGGLKRAGLAPEVIYVLGFSPQNQKMDGKYHNLKVAMANQQKYEIQARKGYYAPKKADDPEERIKQEIAEAVFSRDEMGELPVEVQTQFFTTAQMQRHQLPRDNLIKKRPVLGGLHHEYRVEEGAA